MVASMKKRKTGLIVAGLVIFLLAVFLLGPVSPFVRFRTQEKIDLVLSGNWTVETEEGSKQSGYSFAGNLALVNRSLFMIRPGHEAVTAYLVWEQDEAVRIKGEIAERVQYSDLHLSLWKNQEAIAMVLLADLPGNLPRGVYDLQFQCFGKDWVYPAALTLN